MPRIVPVEVEQDILSKYYTHTARQIAEEYDFKYKITTIKGIWQRNGLTGKSKKFPEDKQVFLNKCQELNYNIEKIAEYYNASKKSVRVMLNKNGIKKELLLTPEQKEEICSQYYDKTAKELAKEYGVSIPYISNIWRDNGLKGKTNRVYRLNENYFEDIDCDEKAYWLGFLAADGVVYKPTDNRQCFIQMTVAHKDEDIIKKFQKSLDTNHPYTTIKKDENKIYHTLSVSSDKMANDLSKYNIKPRKTYSDNWPTLLEEHFIPAYIRGYFDGDGSISSNIKLNNLYQVNVCISGFGHNLQHFVDYLASKNINSRLAKDNRKYNTKEKDDFFCSLCFSNKKEKANFLHLIYDNASIYLERKYLLAQKFFECVKENPKTWTVKKDK